MRVLGIDNVVVPVGELAGAKEFYAGALGLPVKFELPEQGIALFDVGGEGPGILLRVDREAGRGSSPAMRVWLEVPDARAAARELAGLGVEPLAPPFEVGTGWTVEVADPWGNVIGLTDYLKRPELGR
ncbi:VOC family protein [Amycolatopsis sp. CA-230715]|uniref:VOC family protein n=1 Tax=Amycolatopsis sp. CA-230715 TaxID=2745196 RepID=UPI001C02D733|nr:VOC family protein [Amycolatopsis sp. CA-230715]QWF80731.1 hypothetical protein HUW46_04155 [Amycolatopsis sp. CA-230715]